MTPKNAIFKHDHDHSSILMNNMIHFRKGEVDAIRRVLDEIDLISLKQTSEGLNEFNFTVGVLNCFFIAYMFGAHPEHLWLVYLIQGMYMIPKRFLIMWNARPLNQALYYLDFCWAMNFIATAVIFVLVMGSFSTSSSSCIGNNTLLEEMSSCEEGGVVTYVRRKSFFMASLGVSCGPLMGANIVLPFVACLFHDVSAMTGLFIHIMPSMVMYTFMWKYDLVKESWPSIFHLTFMDRIYYFPKSDPLFVPGFGLDSIAGSSIAIYLLWLICYVCFMLFIGIDLPKEFKPDGTHAHPKYDTVFHYTMRGNACIFIGEAFRGRSKQESLKQCDENNFEVIDFFILMTCHLIAVLASFYFFGYLCFVSQRFHLFTIAIVAALAVTRGSKRYTYYTKIYSITLRRQFASLIHEPKD